MSTQQLLQFFLGSIPPAILGFVVILLTAPRSADRHDGSSRAMRKMAWVLPVLLFVPFAVLQPVIAGKVVWMPRSVSEWALPVGVFGLVFSLVTAALPTPGGVGLGVRFAMLVGIAALISRTFLGRWSAIEIAVWLGGFAVLTFVAGRLLARVHATSLGVDGIGVLTIFTLAAAVACEPGMHSLPSAQFIGVVAWTLIGASAAALLRPSLLLAPNAASLPLLVAMSIVFAAALTSGSDVALWLKPTFGLLLVAVPGLAVLFDRVWPATPEGPRLKRSIARLVLASLPLLVIGGLGAWQAMKVQESGYEY